MKTVGHELMIRAYIDTNIFDYVAIRHPKYGEACKKITDDIRDGKIEAYCSYLVPIEILGSLASVDPNVAAGAILAFFSFSIKMIQIDQMLIKKASEIMREIDITYDSIHAAAMKLEGIDTIITEDIAHWRKIENIKIIRPLQYKSLS